MKQLVYAMTDRQTGLLKIGISVNPVDRVKEVARQFGANVELLGTLEVEDARKVEQFIHAALSKFRVMGEWFQVDRKTLGYVTAFFNKPDGKKVLLSNYIVQLAYNAEQDLDNVADNDTCTSILSALFEIEKEVKQTGKVGNYPTVQLGKTGYRAAYVVDEVQRNITVISIWRGV